MTQQEKKIELPAFSNPTWVKQLCSGYLNTIPWNVLLDIGPGVPDSEAWIIDEWYDGVFIMGFEPSETRYNMIKDSYPGEIHKLAISSHCGMTGGFVGGDEMSNQFYLFPHDGQDESSRIGVECMSIDKICSEMPDNLKAFLWIDAEGSEFEILRGAAKTIMAGKIIAMNVEINFDEFHKGTSAWPKWYEIFHYLHCLGFLPIGCADANSTLGWIPDQDEMPQDQRWQYLSSYNLSSGTNPHSDIFFLYAPEQARKLKPHFFKVT